MQRHAVVGREQEPETEMGGVRRSKGARRRSYCTHMAVGGSARESGMLTPRPALQLFYCQRLERGTRRAGGCRTVASAGASSQYV